MKAITRDIVERIELEASLQRLGVTELAERLEFSPLLAAGGLQDSNDWTAPCCLCKRPDDVPDILDTFPRNPFGGDGSTGPTDGSRW